MIKTQTSTPSEALRPVLYAYLPFSEIFKQICFSCLIMLISDFMEQDKLLPYNLVSNGRGLADQRGRSFRVVVTFGYLKSVEVICNLAIVYKKRLFQGKLATIKRVWRLHVFSIFMHEVFSFPSFFVV